MPKKNQEKEALLKCINEAIKQDELLRTQFKIGDKFRFIREKLQALLKEVEDEFNMEQKEVDAAKPQITEDDINVYVYLFNAQGVDLQSWRKMLNPDVFYEYSISRPIYTDKQQVDKFIETRPTRTQHGYLTISIRKDQLVVPKEETKDAIGNPVVKVKEGSLKINRVSCFTHNNTDYSVGSKGELIAVK